MVDFVHLNEQRVHCVHVPYTASKLRYQYRRTYVLGVNSTLTSTPSPLVKLVLNEKKLC